MVSDPTSRGEPLELLRAAAPGLRRRTRGMLEELARLLGVPEETAQQLAIASTLRHVKAGRAMLGRPVAEPAGDPPGDHKRGSGRG